MEHSHFFEQDHSDTTTFSLADFSAQFYEQRFDITPLNISTRGASEDQFESALVLPLHAEIVPRSSTVLPTRFALRRLTFEETTMHTRKYVLMLSVALLVSSEVVAQPIEDEVDRDGSGCPNTELASISGALRV